MQNLKQSHFDTLRCRYGPKSNRSLLGDAVLEFAMGRTTEELLTMYPLGEWTLVVLAVEIAVEQQMEEGEKP